MNFLHDLELMMNIKELISIAKTLNRIHNPYLIDYRAWEMLYRVLGADYRFLINRYKDKASPFSVINDIILKYSPGERIVKYNFIKKYINKQDEVMLFEMNIDNSRADICSINRKSIAYEIKTEFDSTVRLEKQINDYLKTFEYVYVITHKVHVEKIKTLIPEECGIQVYNLLDGEGKFKTIRKAQKNIHIDFNAQIRNLTSEDLRIILREIGVKNIPSTRLGREEIIYKRCNERKINKMFKFAIKRRYNKQWEFICNNFNKIFPIDIQSFFHSPVDPELLYSESIYLKNLEL